MVFKLVISKLVQTSMYYYVHWHTNKCKLNKKRKKTGPRIDGEAMKGEGREKTNTENQRHISAASQKTNNQQPTTFARTTTNKAQNCDLIHS